MSARFFSPESPRVLIRNSPITGPVHTLRVSIGPCCPFLFGAGPHAACANSPIHPLFIAGPHVACAGSPIHPHHSRYTRCACRFVHSPISGPVHTLRTPMCPFPIRAGTYAAYADLSIPYQSRYIRCVCRFAHSLSWPIRGCSLFCLRSSLTPYSRALVLTFPVFIGVSSPTAVAEPVGAAAYPESQRTSSAVFPLRFPYPSVPRHM